MVYRTFLDLLMASRQIEQRTGSANRRRLRTFTPEGGYGLQGGMAGKFDVVSELRWISLGLCEPTVHRAKLAVALGLLNVTLNTEESEGVLPFLQPSQSRLPRRKVLSHGIIALVTPEWRSHGV